MKSGCNILHQRNSGAEVKIGKYFADGVCLANRRVLEFEGCFWHENNCDIFKKADTVIRQKRKQYTTERNAYIQQQGYTITIITDHEFENNCKTDPQLKEFVHRRTPPFSRDNSRYKRFSEQDTINAVRSENLYGFVEVDISVPDHLYTRFCELSPIFCTVSLPHEEWGDLMQTVAEEQDLCKTPRTQLVGGMKARQIMLANPLLKWYLDNGLSVARVSQVVEYAPMKCFADFAQTMTQARRAGDGVMSDTCKLLANSSYGSLLLDRSRHCTVKYTTNAHTARTWANNRRFGKNDVICDDMYEVQSVKSKIKLDLPVHLRVYLLQMAKLHMLKFHYDVFDKYVPRQH